MKRRSFLKAAAAAMFAPLAVAKAATPIPEEDITYTRTTFPVPKAEAFRKMGEAAEKAGEEMKKFGDAYYPMIQDIKVTMPLEREELWELGRKGPYHRFVSFPVEVTSEIKVFDQDYELPQQLDSPEGRELCGGGIS